MHPGRVIQLLRRAEGWSQRDLSKRIGVARTYLAQVESGKREPGLVLLRDAALQLQVPVALLLANEAGPEEDINNELRELLAHVLDAREKIIEQTA